MRTAERLPLQAPERASPPGRPLRRWARAGLVLVLLAGLGLRLWGVRQGLPYAYNTDEADHFVSHAVRMFEEGTLNPHYFANPPAFTYLLHYLFGAWYGGGAGVRHAFALHPSELYTLGRVAAAVLGTLSLWLLYATGARLFNRGVGLLAAAIEAVAFLPLFYAHLALNDVPTLAPLTLSLLGTAGVLRKGRKRDYLLAGAGLGLACATKYTAGIALVPLLAALAARYLDAEQVARRGVLAGLALVGAAALLGFLIANPYAVLDYDSFHRELVHQSALSAESQGKLGAPKHGGIVYYLWSLTWGLGWVPALAALGGALTVWRSQRRLGWLLVPAPLLFLAFMGLQGRYFGRWLMPILPVLCLLAAFFIVQACEAGARFLAASRRGRPPWAGVPGDGVPGDGVPGDGVKRAVASPVARIALLAALIAVTLAQGLVHGIHSGLVLSRADTRNLTRAWMLTHIPLGSAIVAEPVSPNEWARERPGAPACPGYRWCKYPSMLSRISPAGKLESGPPRLVEIENYERTLAPALIGYYTSHRYCWVLSGSTQSGRAFADPAAVALAIAYYRALAQQGEVVYRASPYARGQGPVAFGFDWSFDYYPLAYRRPGPQITIYRLRGGRCQR
jgi:Dolichyl-phosphate-mannose-protein mannosyltransferase